MDGVIEGITDRGNVASAAMLEPLDTQLEELSASRLITNEEGCDKKDENVPEEMMVTNFTLKEITEAVHNIGNTNSNIVEANLNST